MKRIVILGATSGIGLAVAKIYIARGWHVGVAGRKQEPLAQLKALAPDRVKIATIDITKEDAGELLGNLIEDLGGMDIYLHASGIGSQNIELDPQIEINTLRTNGEGFVRMICAAYSYFTQHGGGQLAAISSIAGTRGLGCAPAYSATKRMQNTYIDSLAQLSHMKAHAISLTDIRPGFVDTPLLRDTHFPMLMQVEPVAKRIVRAIDRRERRLVIDRRYAVLVALWRLIPQCIWERLNIRGK